MIKENHKQTFVSLLGLEKAKAEVVRFEKEIQSELQYFQGDTSYLKSLIRLWFIVRIEKRIIMRLYDLESPEQIQYLSLDQLKELCDDIR